MGDCIKRLRIRQRELGGMQIVGEGNGRKEEGQDADQSDEALPFPAIRRAFTKLRQPLQAPHKREGDGDRQPDRVEEKFHTALILEEANARGNREVRLSARMTNLPGEPGKDRSAGKARRKSRKQILQGSVRPAVLLLHFRTGVIKHFGGVS